jgi:DNA helicase HerA-like ATPase
VSAGNGKRRAFERKTIAHITHGSLLEGLVARLADDADVEDLRVGRFVVVEGVRNRFFSSVHDVTLEAANPAVLKAPPPELDLARSSLAGTQTYVTVELKPKLMLERSEGEIHPVKTIPGHFARVAEATDEDVALVFGEPGETMMRLGSPLEMDSAVCLDLERFVERSNGVFGKTGTGKSFLVRMVLAGLVRSRAAVNLVFDMHNEYGWESYDEETRRSAPSLKQAFDSEVLIFTLDPTSSARRKVTPDFEVHIAYDDIEVDDLALIRDELRLTDAGLTHAESLQQHLGRKWLSEFLDQPGGAEMEEFAKEHSLHSGALQSLQRNLRRLKKLPFLKETGTDDSVERIVKALLAGKHVVIEFGRQTGSMLAYMLVANILTRRIHERWCTEKESSAAEGTRDYPPQLVITIEEAHKFLSATSSGHSIFGTIAREMRKYNVGLLVVDQRPSGIEEEVLSQLGTRIMASLDDDRDQQSALAGTPDARAMRVLLNNLEPKKQVLLAGYALPMPIVIDVDDYYEFFQNVRRSATGVLSGADPWAGRGGGSAPDA